MKEKSIRIEDISIKNYKGIDSLKLSFPKPLVEGDPDIFAMGSENGTGKTSIIECCCLLLLAIQKNRLQGDFYLGRSSIDIPNLMINAAAIQAKISASIIINGKKIRTSVTIDRNHSITFRNSSKISMDTGNPPATFRSIITGLDLNPILSNNFLLFHSYRKVHEGSIDMDITSRNEIRRQQGLPPRFPIRQTSIFKEKLLTSYMAQLDLFEVGKNSKERMLEVRDNINLLLETYAKSEVGSFGMSDEIRSKTRVDINVRDKKTGDLFNFDGLSSGQKDIVSTIFLIWYSTIDNPCVVFIDEPELHQNSGWHRKFIKHITQIAPNNQYIIATHSKFIMDAIDENYRVFLELSD